MTSGPTSRNVARLVYGWTSVSMSRTARLVSTFIRGGFRLAGKRGAHRRPRTGGVAAAGQEPVRPRPPRGKALRPTATHRSAPHRANPIGKADIRRAAQCDRYGYDPRDIRPSPDRARS